MVSLITLLRIGWFGDGLVFFLCRDGQLQSSHETMDDQITTDVAEGGNHGGDDYGRGVVDDVLGVRPEPARHHILPDWWGGDFDSTIY